MPASDHGRPTGRTFGLHFWMERVLEELDRASRDFTPDPVHDLRVALRRCRSMAQGLMAIDSDKAWGALQKEAKRLFRRLGELRDVQVMKDWTLRLGAPEDPVSLTMLDHLARREQELKLAAVKSLRGFDRDWWRGQVDRLHARALLLRAGGTVSKLIALQAWMEAHALHRQALRNRSAASYHRLRIGTKKFRYSVENFLPLHHDEWGGDLKEIQDCLGEAQDLRVLWATILGLRPFPDVESRNRWRALIAEERTKRVAQYRQKMVGRGSLWKIWRQALPPQNRLHVLSLQLVEKWATFQGIDLDQARHVRRLALQLFDGLRFEQRPLEENRKDRRTLLHLASILHDLGRGKRKKNDAGARAPLLSGLPLPPGLSPELLKHAELVIRCQRGRLKDHEDREIGALSEEHRRVVLELAGILRLARVLARTDGASVGSIISEPAGGLVVIRVAGYDEFGPMAEKVARARCLLERVYRRPIVIRSDPGEAAQSGGDEQQEPESHESSV